MIQIPKQLQKLLSGTDLHGFLTVLTERVSVILADNKLRFFPDYTDHGLDHVSRVLDSAVSQIPKAIWETAGEGFEGTVLTSADAAVILASTLLHDLGMHLTADGFRELIAPDSRFQPLDWFNRNHDGHSADLPWDLLWEQFEQESRRLSDRALAKIIGKEAVRGGWKFVELPKAIGDWTHNHNLIIGEFIRRHHARLAHEIAMSGFPGAPAGWEDGKFPALATAGSSLGDLADLIGLVARSHGTSLRVCKAYLDATPRYKGTPQPLGSAVIYPMALLRVADYLQIDQTRAPAVLLQLRDPQSPVSIMEWGKHHAVRSITPANDPRGLRITINESLPLSLFLQLEELLDGLQHELDHSTAVLSEAYGRCHREGLDKLELETHRVDTNLRDPVFRAKLPYLPEPTGFSADPNLLTLLVEPLYGQRPDVGVRELIQNAVDAVRECRTWRNNHRLAEPDAVEPDVLVGFHERDNDTWFLRVTDRGIGMSPETVRDYFLRAGASFRNSADWLREFVGPDGTPLVARAGRFGVGAFATFLLGNEFRLTTRHISSTDGRGCFLEGKLDADLIEIQRGDVPAAGTAIEVELTESAVRSLGLKKQPKDRWERGTRDEITDWYCWEWPTVLRRIYRKDGTNTDLRQQFKLAAEADPRWSKITPDGFEAVHWCHTRQVRHPPLICNGMRIAESAGQRSDFWGRHSAFGWPKELPFQRPELSVVDIDANLPLTVDRFGLARVLPFIDSLTRDVTLSVIAHALVAGPTRPVFTSRPEVARYPGCPDYMIAREGDDYGQYDDAEQDDAEQDDTEQDKVANRVNAFNDNSFRWISTQTHFVPSDPWLFGLLQRDLTLAYGGILEYRNQRSVTRWPVPELSNVDACIVCWDVLVGRDYKVAREERATSMIGGKLLELASDGIEFLHSEVTGSRVLVSCELGVRNILRKAGVSTKESRRKSSDGRHRVELKAGSSITAGFLEKAVDSIERSAVKSKNKYEAVYIAAIAASAHKGPPKSLLAQIWHECLGRKAVPFDAKQRARLVKDGLRHPELKRHIQSWQEIGAN